MEPEDLQVLPLHKYPEYLKPCCDMINEEWPRSVTARMMSLQASCDNLPTSLILINNSKQILGHCKLSRLHKVPEGCFLEAVVITKTQRGKKLGTFLMKRVERYCKNVLKLQKVLLSTRGQEKFYEKLGYEICEPVSLYGNFVPSSCKKSSNVPVNSVPVKSNTNNVTPPIPPPPPMPKISTSTTKVYMFKYLS